MRGMAAERSTESTPDREPVVRAKILDPRSLDEVDSCSGADAYGDCPRQQGCALPCAGMVLDAEAPSVGWELRIEVGQYASRCPLRGFAVSGVTAD